MIVIIDYGVGNLGSLLNMCKHIGVSACVSKNESDVFDASHIILPGVGSFDPGMKKLTSSVFLNPLNESVIVRKTPVLGICLGMQMMTNGSEEGSADGLGWIDAKATLIPKSYDVKVPHMGWNRPSVRVKSALLDSEDRLARYYFLHSYGVVCSDRNDSVAHINYGSKYDVAIQKGNIYGVQFHPEKSHDYGMELLRKFSALESG
jgi:imidazole glycerol-phosphate synthase subunit HisH